MENRGFLGICSHVPRKKVTLQRAKGGGKTGKKSTARLHCIQKRGPAHAIGGKKCSRCGGGVGRWEEQNCSGGGLLIGLVPRKFQVSGLKRLEDGGEERSV